MRGRFQRYELRTTDLKGARAFYAEVLGPRFWSADASLIALPERAAARGAPPHWLGHIVVPHQAGVDVEAAANQLVSRGAQQLGPIQRGTDGAELAVLRDPFGAVLALRHEAPNAEVVSHDALSADATVARATSVAWHQLHTRDLEQALAWYRAQFGWTARERIDLASGPELGGLRTFAWDEVGLTVGGISNAARLPQVHPQWLFCFRVADLAATTVRASVHGGRILDPIQTASGDRFAGGEDPQGAAFGLYQVARATQA